MREIFNFTIIHMKYGIIIKNGISGQPVVKQVHDLNEVRVLEETGWYQIQRSQRPLCEKYLNRMVKFITDDDGIASVVDLVKIPIQ